MSAAFKELLPSTCIEFAKAGAFTDGKNVELAVVRGQKLQLFEIIESEDQHVVPEASLPGRHGNENLVGKDATEAAEASKHSLDSEFADLNLQFQKAVTTKGKTLRIIYEKRIYGDCIGLECLERQDQRSVLLLAVKDAKISTLEWNPSTLDFDTVSIHYFENEPLSSSEASTDTFSKLLVERKQLCIGLFFNRDRVALIPTTGESTDVMFADDNNNALDTESRFFGESFVIPLSQFDDSIRVAEDVQFLEGYREPTLAILYLFQQTHAGILELRKDTAVIKFITLDLEGKASAVILTAASLPYTMKYIMALPKTTGGCLVIGDNEVVYIDSAGKKLGASVNMYGSREANAHFEDRSDLDLKLEGSCAALFNQSSSPSVVIVTKKQEFLVVNLRTEGKSVRGIELRLIDTFMSLGVNSLSAMEVIDENTFFAASRISSSHLISWAASRAADGIYSQSKMGENHSLQNIDADDALESIYDNGDTVNVANSLDADRLVFRITDTLFSVGPIIDFTLGISDKKYDLEDGALVGVCGYGNTSAISVFTPYLPVSILATFEFPESLKIWTLKVTTQRLDPLSRKPIFQAVNEFDNYLLISKAQESLIFTIGQSFNEISMSDFDPFGATIEVGTFSNGERIAQVTDNSIRVYDSDFQLVQLIPVQEELILKHGPLISAQIENNFLIVSSASGYFQLFKNNMKSKELETFAFTCEFPSNTIASTCITNKFSDSRWSSIFKNSHKTKSNNTEVNARNEDIVSEINVSNALQSEKSGEKYVLLLVTISGLLKIYDLENNSCIHSSDLNLEKRSRHEGSKSSVKNPMFSEMIITDFGSKSGSLHLVARSFMSNICVFSIDRYESEIRLNLRLASQRPDPFFVEVLNQNYELENMEKEFRTLLCVRKFTVVPNEELGISVHLMSEDPIWILDTDHSFPHILSARSLGDIVSLSSLNTEISPNSIICVTETSHIKIYSPKKDVNLDGTMCVSSTLIAEDLHAIAYHQQSGVYIISSSVPDTFKLDYEEDMDHLNLPIPTSENDITAGLLGKLHLVSPKTWNIIDTIEFSEQELAVTLSIADLEVNDSSKVRKPFLVAVTNILKGEDVAMRGTIYVYEVVEVVPERNRPEAKFKLRRSTKEAIKGLGSAVCDINGYLLTVQGLKAIVRVLEDEDHLVPVAFVDLGVYTTVAKSLRDFVLFGDLQGSVRLVAFMEEPYRMISLADDPYQLAVEQADFLVFEDKLYIAVADTRGTLHIFQFDPENSVTLNSDSLIKIAETYLGVQVTTMKMVPISASDVDEELHDAGRFLVICTGSDGSIRTVIPLSERSYYRLNNLQGQIINQNVFLGNLNPREFQKTRSTNELSISKRGLIDLDLVNKFTMLDFAEREHYSRRANLSFGAVHEEIFEANYILDYI